MMRRLEEIKKAVKIELTCSAHNMEHIERVYNSCKKIAHSENDVDMEILLASALLHDIGRVREDADKSGKTDHAILSAKMAEHILKHLEYTEEQTKRIQHCIVAHRFRSGNEPKSIEAKILFDADKLDVIGSVGIARSFMIAGQFGQKLHIEDSVNTVDNNSESNGRLKDVSKHSVFAEYEFKFKKIPQRLYTTKAKEIAKDRMIFMESFFDRLKEELKGSV